MGWQITFDGTRRELTPDELSDPFATHWEGGKVVDLDDLSPDVFDTLAREESGDTSWWGVYRFPCGNGGRMYAVACAAAEHAEIGVPAKPANMRESKLLLSMFEQTEDIEDKPIVNGFPQTPPAAEIGSSSGPSDDSGGDPPKPAPKP